MLKRLEIAGFKSFARKTVLDFSNATTAIVGPNGSGKSNVAEAFRFALGEQSMKSMRGKRADDLIWNGSANSPRGNRAAVSIVFDNSKRIFKIDFDEVSVERAVFRDGTSEYAINGSKVRLRDVAELLAGANIGETGHHIISQGEADRILISNNRERREILEDALGLKLYEFKKIDAKRKLEKTQENIAQVESLRRELAPHLRFLEKQVEKLEKAEALGAQLVEAAKMYFAHEDAYLAHEKKHAEELKAIAAERAATAGAELAKIEERATTDAEGGKRLEAVRKAEAEIERLTSERAALAREIGQTEGALAAAKKRSTEVAREPYAKVPREELVALKVEIEKQAEAKELSALEAAIKAIRAAVKVFVDRYAAPSDDLLADEERTVFALENEKKELTVKDHRLSEAIEQARAALHRAREALTAHDETGRELRRRILDLAQTKAKEEGEVARLEARINELAFLARELEEGKRQVAALVGPQALVYHLPAQMHAERKEQEDRRRALERLKIRVEEAGGGGEDIRKEYKDASEREQFLARELEDLAKSARGLESLIADLETELARQFADGLASVNASFTEYFALMFGGGSARLVLEAELGEAEDPEESHDVGSKSDINRKPGIEIAVNLPRKKIRSLLQLSGGERALTSIALIFAMSQVNPPPFLILDETDAALDEANSRRYGDMLENLAKKSQLIVITHNRETMSRAGILYGVTMGSDGVSRLLSVKFEEAVQVAK